MNLSILLEIPAGMHPGRVAVCDEATTLEFAQLTSRASAWGAWLRTHDGSRPVAYLGGNRVAFVELLFGAGYAGRPIAPLNYRVKADELGHFLEEIRPAVLVTEERYDELVTQTGAEVEVVHPDIDLPTAAVEAPFDPAIPAALLFTSGTTGLPQPETLTHGNLTSYVLATVEAGSAGADEAVLLSVPPYHIAGVANVLSNIHRARRLVLLADFDPRNWLDKVREESITHAFVVPTMLVRILKVLETQPDLAPSHLQSLAYGGSKAPEGLIARALAVFPEHVGFINAFGLTETSSTVSVLTPEDHRAAVSSNDPTVQARLDSAGRPMPNIELTIVDEEGHPQPPGIRGEIWIRGPQVVATAVDADGWLHTGDLGSLDDDGYLFVHGRMDDVIIRGGENVVPGEIQAVLENHPSVIEAAVIGVPDSEWGQVVGALVVGDRVTDKELQHWVRRHLAGYKTPTVIRWCDELPRNDMGKVVRGAALDLLRHA